MKEPHNTQITALIPERYRDRVAHLELTPTARSVLEELAEELSVPDVNVLFKHVAHSAASFAVSDYFAVEPWFRNQPYHPFKAVKFELSDGTETEAVLVLEPKTGIIRAEAEVVLPDDYPEERVLAEVKAEFFPIIKE
jgi:hypothetical protein